MMGEEKGNKKERVGEGDGGDAGVGGEVWG